MWLKGDMKNSKNEHENFINGAGVGKDKLKKSGEGNEKLSKLNDFCKSRHKSKRKLNILK